MKFIHLPHGKVDLTLPPRGDMSSAVQDFFAVKRLNDVINYNRSQTIYTVLQSVLGLINKHYFKRKLTLRSIN